jgi:hypothetical protein
MINHSGEGKDIRGLILCIEILKSSFLSVFCQKRIEMKRPFQEL